MTFFMNNYRKLFYVMGILLIFTIVVINKEKLLEYMQSYFLPLPTLNYIKQKKIQCLDKIDLTDQSSSIKNWFDACDISLMFEPNDEYLLLNRAIARMKIGDYDGSIVDINKGFGNKIFLAGKNQFLFRAEIYCKKSEDEIKKGKFVDAQNDIDLAQNNLIEATRFNDANILDKKEINLLEERVTSAKSKLDDKVNSLNKNLLDSDFIVEQRALKWSDGGDNPKKIKLIHYKKTKKIESESIRQQNTNKMRMKNK